MASIEEISKEDYDVQLHRYFPSTFVQEVTNICFDHFGNGLDKLEERLKELPSTILPKKEMNKGMMTLRVHTNDRLESITKRVENHTIENIMKIPPYLLLPSDLEQKTPRTETDVTALEEEIEKLQLLLKQEKYTEKKMLQELKKCEIVVREQDKLINCLATNRIQPDLEEFKETYNYANNKVGNMKEKTINFALNSIEQEPNPLRYLD